MKLLVGYDGSDQAKRALAVGEKLAKGLGAHLDVVTSIRVGDKKHIDAIEAAENVLEEIQKKMEDSGIKCKTLLLLRGLDPGEDIVTYIDDNNIDQVIIGFRKRSQLGKMLLGSNTQYVLFKSKCDVLSVR